MSSPLFSTSGPAGRLSFADAEELRRREGGGRRQLLRFSLRVREPAQKVHSLCCGLVERERERERVRDDAKHVTKLCCLPSVSATRDVKKGVSATPSYNEQVPGVFTVRMKKENAYILHRIIIQH